MKFKKVLDKYASPFSRVCLVIAVIAAVILGISKLSVSFSDLFNRYISSFCRLVVSKITGILPFSLGEAMFLCLPLFVVVALYLFFKVYSDDDVKSVKFIVTLVTCLSLMFSSFVFMFGVAYNTSSLDKKLELEMKAVSYEELEYTADCIMQKIQEVIEDIEYSYKGSSVLPYSFGELNEKLNDAYESLCGKYKFVPELRSNVKILAVSPVMTYTHISGVFTYYTGEANLNINYPDYSLPYTMAHEMAHQRGFARENEANFIAFLVCLESDDPYIRYSACVSMYEYVISAMSSASHDDYNDYIADMDLRVRGEMVAFSRFFDPYRDSVASSVTNTINDTYLKASGDKAGTQSYGLVVDLACAYFAQ